MKHPQDPAMNKIEEGVRELLAYHNDDHGSMAVDLSDAITLGFDANHDIKMEVLYLLMEVWRQSEFPKTGPKKL